MGRKLFAKLELDFWLDSEAMRSSKPCDRGYYADIWARGVRGGSDVIDGWQLVFRSLWRCRASRVRSIVARLAAVQHAGKPLLIVISDTKLHVCGLARVHTVAPEYEPLVRRDVDVDVDEDVEEERDVDVDGRVPDGTQAGTAETTASLSQNESEPNGTAKSTEPLKETRVTGPALGDDFQPYDPYPWIPQGEGARGAAFNEPSSGGAKGAAIMDALREAGRLEDPGGAKVAGPASVGDILGGKT